MSVPGDSGRQLSALPERPPLFRRREFIIGEPLAEDDPSSIDWIINFVVIVVRMAAANQKATSQIRGIGLVRRIQSIRRSIERIRLAEAVEMLRHHPPRQPRAVASAATERIR